jgi:hypothetical protein
MGKLLPKTLLGKLSVISFILMPLLFYIATFILDSMYVSVSSGDTILEDIKVRPLLALTMLLANLLGILSFVFGIIAIKKLKEKSILVWVCTVLGGLLTIFLLLQLTSIF